MNKGEANLEMRTKGITMACRAATKRVQKSSSQKKTLTIRIYNNKKKNEDDLLSCATTNDLEQV